MINPEKMFNGVKVAIVASDPDFNVIYANQRCKEIFKSLLNMEDFVGKNMSSCHKPETMEKLRTLYAEYREKKRNIDYYKMDIPGGKAAIVNVPIYDGDVFAGVMEFVFEDGLD